MTKIVGKNRPTKAASQARKTPAGAIGKKRPFTAQQVETIRMFLADQDRKRDLALFNVGIDTLLRSSDLIPLRVSDVMQQQKRNKRPVTVALHQASKTALEDWIHASDKMRDDYLFTRLKGDKSAHITTHHYRMLVKEWVELLHLDASQYGTHSLRRTRPTIIYDKTKNVAACSRLLGHKTTGATIEYIGVETEEALAVGRKFSI